MEQTILKTLAGIRPPDRAAMGEALARQDSLAKPPHSLGKLEDLSVKLAGMTGKLYNPVERRRVLIFASDNGIVEEGVSGCPQSVTLRQTVNFARGLTGVSVLARHFHSELDVTDVGVNADFREPGVRDMKIAHGTNNFAKAHAMTREQAVRAVQIGIDAALRAKAEGIQIIGVGEMGIGNTTTSSAVLSALLGAPAADTVSRGSGINDAAYARKVAVIDGAIARWKPDPADPLDVLAKVGGFDLAAMCGAFIGAASVRMPAVIDGFISAAAALCACRLNPLCAAYMIASHASTERGCGLAMEAMRLEPLLMLNMRLGEGSGCPIAFELVAASQSVLRDMATFEEAHIDDGYLAELRGNKAYLGEA